VGGGDEYLYIGVAVNPLNKGIEEMEGKGVGSLC
jgi:hypothetical protein